MTDEAIDVGAPATNAVQISEGIEALSAKEVTDVADAAGVSSMGDDDDDPDAPSPLSVGRKLSADVIISRIAEG